MGDYRILCVILSVMATPYCKTFSLHTSSEVIRDQASGTSMSVSEESTSGTKPFGLYRCAGFCGGVNIVLRPHVRAVNGEECVLIFQSCGRGKKMEAKQF